MNASELIAELATWIAENGGDAPVFVAGSEVTGLAASGSLVCHVRMRPPLAPAPLRPTERNGDE